MVRLLRRLRISQPAVSRRNWITYTLPVPDTGRLIDQRSKQFGQSVKTMNKRYSITQLIIGMADAIVLFTNIYMNAVYGSQSVKVFLLSTVMLCGWIAFRLIASERGIIPLPWDGEDWDASEKKQWKHPGDTEYCPHCGLDIVVKDGEFQCSNYPDCGYKGGAVDSHE